MTATGRIRAEMSAASRAFLRRRTAVFFTFVFPLLLVVIFGALITTGSGGGLFTENAVYYVPGYLAVVVLFTPLSRVGSEVARHRADDRFEKLSTTPLRRSEWLLAGTVVNLAIIGIAGAMILGLMVLLTGAQVVVTPVSIALLGAFVVAGVACFCGVGAIIGSLADSQDGVIAASNTIALPVLFLSETFVPPTMLPSWLPTVLSPLTYFSRGVRSVASAPGVGETVLTNLLVLVTAAVVALVIGAITLPRTD